MRKFWIVLEGDDGCLSENQTPNLYNNKEDALEDAKELALQNNQPYLVFEMVGGFEIPCPVAVVIDGE